MSSTFQVGSILMKECPQTTQLLGLETEPCSEKWNLLTIPEGSALDKKISAAGWNFFFLAAEVKVTFFGSIGAEKMQNALKRILAKVKQQHFNSLQVTEIVARHFFGVPYVTVSAHSRHIQQGCYLDSPAARQMSQNDAESARG
jgi:hypothetical protein